jgi:hypothetical protein
MQPAMATSHDAWLRDTRARVTPAVPVPPEVFTPTMRRIAPVTPRVQGRDAFAKLPGHGASAPRIPAAWRLRRILLAWPGGQIPGQPVIGTDHHDRAACEPQAGARHRPQVLRRLSGLGRRPGRTQDQQLGVRCPVQQSPGGQFVRQLGHQPSRWQVAAREF